MFPPSIPDAGSAPAGWLLGTLDREFALFEHLLRYGKSQSGCTIANHRVAFKNLRTFLAATVGEAHELPHPLFDPLAWLAWNRMKTKPPGEASMHTYWSKNRTFFRFLVEKHGIADPFAKAKAPNSPVAGRATVFVFPDLNTGNTTYKAVQRSAHVISVGPMLQGMRRPVNDLSRGALVEDIVYTIALTAVQAGQRAE